MPTEPSAGMSRMRVPLFILIALVVGFLAGFIVQYSRTSDYSELQKQQQLSQLRDELLHAYLQVTNKNFGQAREQSTKFFNDLRVFIASTKDEDLKNQLWPLMKQRDQITARLAQGNPAAEKQIRDLLNEILKTAGTQNR
jgi:uncharacterized membrane-anchored protein YhcB (DUF1043 family)